MALYGGFDLHSSNNYLAIIDENDKRILKKKLDNDPDLIISTLKPYQNELKGVVVESTFNWYWLIDILMDNDFKTHLANPSAVKKYEGLKHSDDNDDAYWLAHLLRLNILPEGYIYPKKQRPIRDLLRKRGHLVQLRTSLILSLQNIIQRNCGTKLGANIIKQTKEDNPLFEMLNSDDSLSLSGVISKESIDHLSNQIRQIEKKVENSMELHSSFSKLQSIPGVGKTLALTIMLETGTIERFNKVGNFASYCRKVPTKWTSNDKTKGSGNQKNGNKYLAWAFSEAAEFIKKFDPAAKSYYQRKMSKGNKMIAHSAVAHKLSRAAFYIMRDDVAYDSQKLFG